MLKFIFILNGSLFGKIGSLVRPVVSGVPCAPRCPAVFLNYLKILETCIKYLRVMWLSVLSLRSWTFFVYVCIHARALQMRCKKFTIVSCST